MPLQDGPKRLGRFMKRNSKVQGAVAIREYSFEEVCEKDLIAYDNTRNNVVIAALHEPEELQQVIKTHPLVTNDLKDEANDRPVLFPTDFTEEWRRLQARRAKRQSGKIDEDELDFEYEVQENRNKAQREAAEAASIAKAVPNEQGLPSAEVKPVASPIPEVLRPPVGTATNNSKLDLENLKITPSEIDNLKRFKAQKENLDKVGAAINHLVEKTTEEIHAELKAKQQEFIPVALEAKNGVGEPEKVAMDEYKDRIEQTQEMAKNAPSIAADVEKLKAAAYEDGFKIGEEKAFLQSKENLSQVLENISHITSELSKLKSSVLTNIQENFYSLCQAMAEALLEREFKINPQSFMEVMARAIKDTVREDSCKIAVDPAFYKTLEAAKVAGFENLIMRDENLKPGEFRIDSNLSVVEGSVRQLITDMLSQADVQLFSSNKEVKKSDDTNDSDNGADQTHNKAG